MGWTYTYGTTRRELVEEVTRTWENERQKTEVIAKYFSGNDLWAVFERTFKPAPDGSVEPTERFIVLFLIRGGKGTWGYKDMEESMGPYYYSCPLKFLDMVPERPRPEGYEDWRAKVRQYWAVRNQKFAIGDIVQLTNGRSYRVIQVRPLRAIDVGTGLVYRLPRNMLTVAKPAPTLSEFQTAVKHRYDTLHQTPDSVVRAVVEEYQAKGFRVPEEYFASVKEEPGLSASQGADSIGE